MTHAEQKKEAVKFVKKWADRSGNEKQETEEFWRDLLQIYGIYSTDHIKFEQPSLLGTKKWIDAIIPATKVLIEQKSKVVIDLAKRQKQSDGTELTPFEQANRYVAGLGSNQAPDWIIVCNFSEFHIYDRRESVSSIPTIVKLKDLPDQIDYMRQFLDVNAATIKHETERSKQAWEIVKGLHNALRQQYTNPDSAEAKKSLNKLCVRLVFCFYADSAEIFGQRQMLYNYLREYSCKNIHYALARLFLILDTPENEREQRIPFIDDELNAFPYINGGLFQDRRENLEHQIPRFTEECRTLLLDYVNSNFEWSEISPTIFGAIFESTLNDETRQEGGMHYTSIENIHKVIDPLFLDSLKAELRTILSMRQRNQRKYKLETYRKKLGSLSFLDPACGSGNFLTLTYTELRELENEALRQELLDSSSELSGQIRMSMHFDSDPIQVKLSRFFGIEINDFAVAVAKTALWIAESQMWEKTRLIYADIPNIIPLTSLPNIVEGNALRMDWNSVVSKEQLSYIISNPPFVGKKEQSRSQKSDMRLVFSPLINKYAILDYVTAWFVKASDFISGTQIAVSFVATNSISQGQQVYPLWKVLLKYGISIRFAYQSFEWQNEAENMAQVHCVIIGFSQEYNGKKKLFTQTDCISVDHISPYLRAEPTFLPQGTRHAISPFAPKASYGSILLDDGKLVITDDERKQLISEDTANERFIRKLIGGTEIIKRKFRWCLWLKDTTPAERIRSKIIREKVSLTEQFRTKSDRPETARAAERPWEFGEYRQPDVDMLVIPKVSSDKRAYIPLEFVPKEVIVNGSGIIIPNGNLYHFGILSSIVHMMWMNAICGRFETRYQYSCENVYNTFPWCNADEKQMREIELTAQQILDARALYPDSTYAHLYDKTNMPPELRKAHRNNDNAVLVAYGLSSDATNKQILELLMNMYTELTANE